MTVIFKKLNFKEQREVFVLNAPIEFDGELTAMQHDTTVKRAINPADQIEFVLTFVKTKADIDQIASAIQGKLKGDAVVWFAYPKGTSKKYNAAINRDQGWEILGKLGFEAVRQIAIDDDWSAVRFRKVAFIKTMSRRKDFAMTEQGKQKTKPTNHGKK